MVVHDINDLLKAFPLGMSSFFKNSCSKVQVPSSTLNLHDEGNNF